MRGEGPKHLTPRDITVLQELIDPRGLTHKEIAYDLGVSIDLVKVCITRMGRKFGWKYSNKHRLTIYAFMNANKIGLVLPTEENI